MNLQSEELHPRAEGHGAEVGQSLRLLLLVVRCCSSSASRPQLFECRAVDRLRALLSLLLVFWPSLTLSAGGGGQERESDGDGADGNPPSPLEINIPAWVFCLSWCNLMLSSGCAQLLLNSVYNLMFVDAFP